jgi:hypothetical protein
MQDRPPVTLSKKKQAIAMLDDTLRGFAAFVPPIFVAGLLYDVPIENFEGQEKVGIYSLLLLSGIAKYAIEQNKRDNPDFAKTYDYHPFVKIIDHTFATADGFASFVIPFLFLGIQDDFHPTVQLFHLPILISSSVYSIASLVRSLDKATQLQSNAYEKQALLRKPRIAEEGFVQDVKWLIDHLNNAIFPAFFLIAPLAFVFHDFFEMLTLPAMAGLGFALFLTAIARFYVYNFQRNHPNDTPKDYPFLVKIIELLSTALGDFGLLAIPLLVLNAFFPLPKAVKIAATATATTYSAIATVSKADDLELLKVSTRTLEEDQNVNCWQSVKNAAANCCGFFPSTRRSHYRYTRSLLENSNETNSTNLLNKLESEELESPGCWNTVKINATSCFSSLFARSSNINTEPQEPLLLPSNQRSLNS